MCIEMFCPFSIPVILGADMQLLLYDVVTSQYFPICASSWESEFNDVICDHLGQG